MKPKLLICTALLFASAFLSGQNTPMADAYKAAGPDAFAAGKDWFPFPSYENRKGWAALFGDKAEEYIARGEQFLDFTWLVATATDYLDFERTGSRARMHRVNGANHQALTSLTLAELAEGKGRFIDQIIDGLYLMTERTSWVHSYHQSRQPSGRSLGDARYLFIDLGTHQWGSDIAVAWHFFNKEFDKVDPSISEAIQRAMNRQIFEPYLDQEKEKSMSWIGIANQSHHLNNWTPWGSANVMLAFLLMEKDNARLHAALERSIESMDLYMNSVKPDGACDEGPGYWSHAAGKLRDYSRIMYDASGGKFNVLDNAQTRAMGEYISRAFIGDGWSVNFSDASARSLGSVQMSFCYGSDLSSKEMKDYAVYVNYMLNPDSPDEIPSDGGYDIYEKLEALRYGKAFTEYAHKALADASGDISVMRANLRKSVPDFTWYPQTRHLIARSGEWVLGAKSGNNGESHNHNDVGSFILFIDDVPLFIDGGTATYIKDTFSSKRYSIWYMQSLWHNLPQINGVAQKEGEKFCASDDVVNPDTKSFKADISGAYPQEAACSKWIRSYALGDDGLAITDEYALKERKCPDAIHFLVRGKVILPGGVKPDGSKVGKGEIAITGHSFDGSKERTVIFRYPKSLSPSVETRQIADPSMGKVWGSEVCRITLTSQEKAPLKARYTYTVKEK